MLCEQEATLSYFDPFHPPSPSRFEHFKDRVSGIFDYLISRKEWLERIGILSVMLAVGQYIFTYGDRIAERQVKDWDIIRQVQLAHVTKDGDAWRGNLGVIGAMQRLTQDCTNYLLPTYDCESFASLRIEETELGGINLKGAVLARGNLRCSNLSGAQLQGADFTGTYLGGTSLKGANLSGTKFQTKRFGKEHPNPFYFANLSDVILSDKTEVDPKWLKCGCVDAGKSLIASPKYATAIKEIRECPNVANICGDVMGNSDMVDPDNQDGPVIKRPRYMARIHQLPDYCGDGDAW